MKYVCMFCGWSYDEEQGEPELGIDPETPFEELPEGFECPECYASKHLFMKSDEYPIFAVMIGTGLRIGEVAGLRWCDIDLDEGIIDINHTLVYYDHRDPGSKRGCYFNVHTPKTSAGVRQVPMLDFVKEAFQMEREYQQAMGIKCEVTIDGYTDFIFVNREGGTYHQGTMNKTIRIDAKTTTEQDSAQLIIARASANRLMPFLY